MLKGADGNVEGHRGRGHENMATAVRLVRLIENGRYERGPKRREIEGNFFSLTGVSPTFGDEMCTKLSRCQMRYRPRWTQAAKEASKQFLDSEWAR